jgi:hypothetical protein
LLHGSRLVHFIFQLAGLFRIFAENPVNMKNAILAFLFSLFLVACKKPQESIATKIKKADHVEVTFFADGQQARPLSFSDAGMLDSLSKLVSDTPMEPKSCASDGKISYKKGIRSFLKANSVLVRNVDTLHLLTVEKPGLET